MLKFTIALLLLLILPFPIILKFIYSKDKKLLYLYFFKINLDTIISKNKKNTKAKKAKKEKKEKKISYKKIPYFLKKIKKLYVIKKLKSNITFGLDDACNTAIIYGLICSIQGLLYHTLKKYLNIKDYSLKVTPNLNTQVVNIKIDSIIFISFAKIILIAIFAKYYLNNTSKVYKHNFVKEDL